MNNAIVTILSMIFKPNTIEKTMHLTLKIGLWLIPLLPLVVTPSLLFPFITGKNFLFRAAIEILFSIWVGLAFMRHDFRPSFTPLLKSATLFIIVLFLADLFSPNPGRAFFSNYERMEGFMMLSHLYLYLVMLLTVFKTRSDWIIFLHMSLVTSILVSTVGLFQKLGYAIISQSTFRIDSTIGNPAYLAAYLVFHIWIAALMLKEFWGRGWARVVYIGTIIFELIIIYFTATRGAAIALFAAAFFLLAVAVFFKEPPRFIPFLNWSLRRKLATVAFVLVVITPLIFWQFSGSLFLQKSPTLSRLTNYSLKEQTIQSRFLIWKMSLRGFLERPILGWGQENYYLVFQKYFDPGLYAEEPWFDRSHNIFFDWLIHAGVFGLVSYLSMFGVVIFYLARGAWRNISFPLWQGLIVASAFLTSFIQNLFVFDNLNTYLLTFAFLAYTQWLTAPYIFSVPAVENGFQKQSGSTGYPKFGIMISLILLLITFIGGYELHYKPVKEAAELISIFKFQRDGANTGEVLKKFREVLSYKTFGDTEIREHLGNAARSVAAEKNISPEDRRAFVDFAAGELRKEIGQRAKDIKHMIFLASILSRARDLNPAYGEEAEQVLQEAINISPTKQILYFELAQLYISEERPKDAVAILKKTVLLDPANHKASYNLVIAGVLAQDPEVIKGGIESLDVTRLNEVEMQQLVQVTSFLNDLNIGRKLYGEMTRHFPDRAEYHAKFAAILAELGEYDEAIKEAKIAVELDSTYEAESKLFFDIINKQRKK